MIQIIAPHLDDAILSLGGCMNNWINKEKIKVKVLYLFSVSDWTNPLAISGLKYEADSKKVSGIRRAEEKSVNNILDYEYELLDYFDEPIRDKSKDALISIEIKEKIIKTMDITQPLYFPLATGVEHHDHKLTREIGFELKKEGLNVRFYEDLPYTAFEESHIKMMERIEGYGLKPEIQEIDMNFKFKCINLYKSQISPDWECASRSYNYSIVDNKYYERYWL